MTKEEAEALLIEYSRVMSGEDEEYLNLLKLYVEVDIDRLGLPRRALNALLFGKIPTIKQLKNMDVHALIKLSGIGRKSATYIIERIEYYETLQKQVELVSPAFTQHSCNIPFPGAAEYCIRCRTRAAFGWSDE